MEDWSLLDCQEYLVDLDMYMSRAVVALEAARREDWGGTRTNQTTKSREMPLDLRKKHLDRQP
jgi:hypothetical protein